MSRHIARLIIKNFVAGNELAVIQALGIGITQLVAVDRLAT
jgi:hypothetical protein